SRRSRRAAGGRGTFWRPPRKGLDRAARRFRGRRVLAALAGLLPRDELLEPHREVLDALGHVEQLGHRRDLLDLLSEAPLTELLAQVVALVSRDPEELSDLLAHRLLLLEGEADRRDVVRKRALG